MKAVKANMTRGLPHGAWLVACDNSGARTLKLISVKQLKTTRRRAQQAAVGDYIMASVVSGKPDMRKQVVAAIVVRQRRPYMRADGTRIKFEDNAAVVVKDDFGAPKGTRIKGPIAKESAERWPALAKVAKIVV